MTSWPADVRPFDDPARAPWSHQLRAFDVAAPRAGTVLHLKMRMGKTLTAAALCVAWGARLVLVTCPTRVVDVWRDELEEHVPGRFEVMILPQKWSTARKAEELKKRLGVARVTDRRLLVVVNHESVWRGDLGNLVARTQWCAVIVDEGHRLKGAGTSVSRFMGRLVRNSRHRLNLTGTFTPKGVKDAYAQMRFVDPSIFGTSVVAYNLRYQALVEPIEVKGEIDDQHVLVKAAFQRTDAIKALRGSRFLRGADAWAVPRTEENMELLERMGPVGSPIHRRQLDEWTARLAPAVVSIDYDEADVALPERESVPVRVDLSPAARAAYDHMREHMLVELEAGEIVAANALVKSLRLAQIASGTVTTDEGRVVRLCDAKARALQDLLEDWDFGADGPVVVFCRFRADLEVIAEVAGKLGVEHGEISGSRKDGVDGRFLAPGKQMVGVQVQSGGMGLDFSSSRLGAFFTLSWSTSDYEQAMYRFLGSRQREAVTFPHVIARGTIDEVMWDALRGEIEFADVLARHLREGRG